MLTLSLDTNQKSRVIEVYDEICSDMEQWLRIRGVSKLDAHDMIQYAMLALSEKLASHGEAYFHKGLEAYAFSVLKYAYFERCRRQASVQDAPDMAAEAVDTSSELSGHVTDEDDRINSLRQILKQLDPKSYAILKLYYFERLSMKEIADRLGFKSECVVKSTKCRLIKKLRGMVKQ